MSLSKQDMMKKTVQFMRALVNENLTTSDAEEMKALVHNYRRELEVFNDDVNLTYTRPFLLMEADGAGFLPEETLDRILRIAADNDMQNEFIKLTSAGEVLCLFSHKGRELVEEISKQLSIGFGNLIGNGIVIDGYHFLGFYSASAERIKAGLVEAELYLQSHE